ncbi:hypothetical protein EHQ46_01270 [Leptospira yanagawae]|uniref:YceI family protein n=1 Tax=Leptospira yanagawae TaxID=293069 RepID=A0ABY2M3L7_9LEPT|nr:hypothetical protein [Leptospira yanagawae]TGL23787.1 hypothetical protein EHQ46_01270 [Leptospira yanagawae]
MKNILIYTILFLGFINSVSGEEISFPKGQSCVAWKTDKTLIVVNKQSPVGLNCKIELKIEQSKLGYKFEGKFPISNFNSNQEMRDNEVRKLLDEEIQPNLIFISNLISYSEWTQKKNTNFELKGIFRKGNRDFNLTFQVSKEIQNGTGVWKGMTKTKFSELGMIPPKVAFGIVTSVNDDLELHFQFIETHIQGFPK